MIGIENKALTVILSFDIITPRGKHLNVCPALKCRAAAGGVLHGAYGGSKCDRNPARRKPKEMALMHLGVVLMPGYSR